MAVSALAGATVVALWPGMAWAYGNFGGPPPSGGGGGGAETVGHQGGANADQPPMNVTNSRPAPGTPETVTDSATSCAPGSAVTIALTYVTPSATPVSFGPGATTADGTGGFSVTGTIPATATAGTWVIFATCNDASGAPLVYTATIVVPGATTGSGVRSAAVASSAARSSSVSGQPGAAASGGGSSAGAGAEGSAAQGSPAAAVWTPPATWGTPALRALVEPAVNAAAVSAPVVLAPASQPVVAHTSGALTSGAPLRDAADAVVGLVAVTGLAAVRRHQHRRSNRWNRRRRTLGRTHRHSGRTRRMSGSKTRGTW
ncbi:MAG TPA: hypothetical protein VFW24_06760 [Acidimicrobiales bacterium]|nr:hypothetical protein [Acidimicrobiales bacterium]